MPDCGLECQPLPFHLECGRIDFHPFFLQVGRFVTECSAFTLQVFRLSPSCVLLFAELKLCLVVLTEFGGKVGDEDKARKFCWDNEEEEDDTGNKPFGHSDVAGER